MLLKRLQTQGPTNPIALVRFLKEHESEGPEIRTTKACTGNRVECWISESDTAGCGHSLKVHQQEAFGKERVGKVRECLWVIEAGIEVVTVVCEFDEADVWQARLNRPVPSLAALALGRLPVHQQTRNHLEPQQAFGPSGIVCFDAQLGEQMHGNGLLVCCFFVFFIVERGDQVLGNESRVVRDGQDRITTRPEGISKGSLCKRLNLHRCLDFVALLFNDE